MSPDECEVFDLVLNGYNPSDPKDVEEFVTRINSPLSDLIADLLQRDILQRVEAKGRMALQVNPAAAWFLMAREDRTAVQ